GVLRHLHRTERRFVAARHLNYQRSAVPHRTVRHDEPLQEDSRSAGMGSHALPRGSGEITKFELRSGSFEVRSFRTQYPSFQAEMGCVAPSSPTRREYALSR